MPQQRGDVFQEAAKRAAEPLFVALERLKGQVQEGQGERSTELTLKDIERLIQK